MYSSPTGGPPTRQFRSERPSAIALYDSLALKKRKEAAIRETGLKWGLAAVAATRCRATPPGVGSTSAAATQGLTLVPMSAELELFCLPHDPT